MSEMQSHLSAVAALAARARGVKLVCLGLSALDQVWRVEGLFAGGSEKIRSFEYTTVGGGMAANAAVAAARLGAATAFWGRGGEDAAGQQMRDALANDGVDVRHFRLFAGGRSSVSGVIVDRSGERQIVNFRGQFPLEADWLPLDELAGTSAVLADPRWPEGAVAMFGKARSQGIPTVLDGDVADASVFERLLPLTDHAVFSEPALRGFAGSPSDEALASLAACFKCRVIAVTRGRDGVSWYEDGHLKRLAAHSVDVVDTTAAGDVFHGAYAIAIGGGLGIGESMSFASVAAALKCTRPGGRAGIPTINDCIEFMRTKE
jgi:sulfofructose kinase